MWCTNNLHAHDYTKLIRITAMCNTVFACLRLHVSIHIGSSRAIIQQCLHSMDSDLEAFNRNPTYGSIATLAYRLAAFALCMNEVFLSY